MKFYLDGYNVIGSSDHIQLSQPDKIDKFIQWLQKHQKKGQQLVVIFDGKNEFMMSATKEHLPGITIIHTSADRSADDYIKEKVLTLSDRSNKVIVSSDRDILFHARKSKFNVMSSPDFLQFHGTHPSAIPHKKSPKITDRHVNYWLNEFNSDNS